MRPARAPALQHGDAVHLRQADVEDDGVIGLGVAEEVPLLAVMGPVDDIARLFQGLGELPVQIPVVLDNQYAHLSASPRSGGRFADARL